MLTLDEKQTMRTLADLIVVQPAITKRFLNYSNPQTSSDGEECLLSKYVPSILLVLRDFENCYIGDNYPEYIKMLRLATDEIKDEDTKIIFKTSIDYCVENVKARRSVCTQKL